MPIPYPVKPAINPFLPLPVAAHVAKPEPNAELKPAPNVPPNKEPPAIDPNIGARKGKKASGCPVSGLIVKGITCESPATSAGLTCSNIESP